MTAGLRTERSATPTAAPETARRLAVVCAVLVAVAAVVLVALRRPSAPDQWGLTDGPGFSVAMPASPTVHLVDGGTAGADTAVVRDSAYTVVWFAVDPGTAPRAAITTALSRLAAAPATLVRTSTLDVGPFAAANLTARLGPDYLHGRLLVVARRAYLIGEVTPALTTPSDLNRLLVGFDPDPAAG